MRRGMPSPATAGASEMRPSYRSTTSASSNAVPGNGTILVNLDVFIQRATVGHDISPLDEDLIVLFRRNSKEITSEPTRWHSDHVAEWNQHVGIQTSLLRGKRGANGSYANEFLKKEYEVVLVALPSHSAVALFTIDFAELVQPQNPVRHKVYRISPLKCRDLAALLEFEIVWDYAVKPAALVPPSPSPSAASVPLASAGAGVSIAGMPPASLLSTMKQHQARPHTSHSGYPETSSSISSRRTTASMSSANSDRDPLADLAGCSECRSSKRRLERKEMQILQLETFLKESQKRLDSLVFENEELLVREQAETANAAQYRALTVRLLQELEMAFQFCATQVMQAQTNGADTATSFMFLPQFEFMERVKQFHYELDALAGASADDDLGVAGAGARGGKSASAQDAWRLFDFRGEMDTALERNQRLQRQLEFLSRSLVYDVADDGAAQPLPYSSNPSMPTMTPRLRRTGTNASADTSGGESDNSLDDSLARSHAAPAFTMTEQLNNLERENFVLKAKLERALADLKVTPAPLAGRSDTGDTHSSSSRAAHDDDDALQLELEHEQDVRAQLEQANAGLAGDKARLEVDLAAARAEVEALQRRVDGAAATTAETSDASAADSSSSGSAAPGFLNKIYQDVGKAKMALEEKVKQLNALLREATDENLRLRAKVEAQQEALEQQQSELDAAPKIAELPDDDDNGGDNSEAAADREWVTALEQQVAALQATLDDSSNQLAAKDRALASSNRAQSKAEQELEASLSMLLKAQNRASELESQVQALEAQLHAAEAAAATSSASASSAPPSPSSFAVHSIGGGDRSDEVAELSKQLKLAKQEVMQLRYRSNQMESVHERLDDALKEKRTLEVKLTALEGQLFDHRSRTISDNSFATDQNALVAELQKQLDQRAAQLLIAQRELEALRRELTGRPASASSASSTVAVSASSGVASVDVDELGAKVTRFEAEIARLCGRNDEQARQLEALGDRITRATHERAELEAICHEMVREMDEMAQLHGAGAPTASGSGAIGAVPDELEDKPAFTPVSVSIPALVTAAATPTKVTDRYASALASSDRVAAAGRDASRSPAAATTQSKVANLIKNFSSDDAGAEQARRPSDPVVKRFAKFDFRARNGSSASARSNSSSSVAEAAARFRSGTASSAVRE